MKGYKGMELLPKSIAETLPPLYSQENVEDPLCRVKLFDIFSQWTWYIIEYDPDEELCFGFVHGFDDELGYFSLAELKSLGIRIERDLYFEPKPLSEVEKLYK